MANVPQTNTTGIQNSEGLLQQLIQYLRSLNVGQPSADLSTPAQVPMTGLPTQAGVGQTTRSLLKQPMTAMPGGGIDPSVGSSAYTSGIRLGSNPVRAGVQDLTNQAKLGIEGQNIGLMGQGLENNLATWNMNQSLLSGSRSLQQMIDALLSGGAGDLGQIGTFPPSIRGNAQSTAASGTGGGGGLLSLFGF